MTDRLLGGKERKRRWSAFRIALFIGTLGMVALLLAGSVAARVPADRYWVLQLIAVGLPLLRLLVAGLAVGALLASWYRRGIILALTLVLSLGLTGFWKEAKPMTTVPEGTAGLTVMSFNASPSRAAQRQHALRGVLEEEAPHVVALQELPVRLTKGNTLGSPLIAPLLQGEAYAIAWPSATYDASLDLPIFSRLAPVDSVQYPVGEEQRGLWRSGGVVRQVYVWQGEQIAVYNAHLHSFGGVRPWQEGWRQALSVSAWRSALAVYREDFGTRARQARDFRALLERELLPFIVCGDLNSTPYSWVYAHLSEGLVDAWKVAGQGWGATYPARLPLVRIDFVLASPEWQVRRAYVVKSLSSDHRPVLAELMLSTPRATPIRGG